MSAKLSFFATKKDNSSIIMFIFVATNLKIIQYGN